MRKPAFRVWAPGSMIRVREPSFGVGFEGGCGCGGGGADIVVVDVLVVCDGVVIGCDVVVAAADLVEAVRRDILSGLSF